LIDPLGLRGNLLVFAFFAFFERFPMPQNFRRLPLGTFARTILGSACNVFGGFRKWFFVFML